MAVSGAFAEGMAKPLSRILKPAQAAKFERAFGMTTIGDLLWHVPRRYAKRGELTPLTTLTVGEHVTVVADVASVQTREIKGRDAKGRPRTLTTVTITDGFDSIDLAFFSQAWRAEQLRPGVTALFSGTVGTYGSRRQLAHPQFEPFDDPNGVDAKAWAAKPIPIYAATAQVSSKQIQSAVAVALAAAGELPDPVPESVRREHSLMSLTDAFVAVHDPPDDKAAYRARHTLVWHEAFLLQTFLLATRSWLDKLPSAPRSPGSMLQAFDDALPWQLTDEQQRASAEIFADLASGTSMHRLVQGEVGSGKTVVALRAMLAVAESGAQSALLAPTEVLAVQHLRSITRMLGPELAAKLQPTLLTGVMPAADRKRAALNVAAGSARIVVGTHALLSESTTFAELALVVVDEQHRFGVAQREALRAKGTHPHTLVLTATPIPRTVAMTAFGDLDVSTIRGLPSGRSPISTFVVPRRDERLFTRVWTRMREEIDAGRQAFVVCPAISPGKLEGVAESRQEGIGSRAADARAAAQPPRLPFDDVETTLGKLQALEALGGVRIAALTGAMSTDEKDAVMSAFAAGDIDVLVATTVVEVGVDVPNASMMVVMSADRFGVSQLHQLRGRVGRGEHPSLCLLVSDAAELTAARERLDAVAGTLDGFELAEVDMKYRGEGDVLGSAQSGVRSGLRALRVTRDGKVIVAARDAARAVLDGDPELERHPILRHAVHNRLAPDARAALVTA